MPITPQTARALVRLAAPLSVACLAMATMVGCPGGAGVVTPQPIDVGGGIPVSGGTFKPSSPGPSGGGASPTTGPVQTAKPVVTQPPQATVPPTSIFATPTTGPTVRPTPALVGLGVLISQGATSSSPFKLNEFFIRFEGDNQFRPDLPSRRVYSAWLLKGITQEMAAATTDLKPGVYATESTSVNWTLSTIKELHKDPVDAAVSAGNSIWFVVGASTSSSVPSTSSVILEVAPAKVGTLLTFTSTVSISTGSAFPDNGASTGSVEILASNEGQLDFVIQSLEVRMSRPARLVP